jgi:hypothetical protein
MFNFLNFRKKKEVEVNTSIITLDDLETKNFKKEEWLQTDTGLDNTPTLGVLNCLLHTSRKMQQIRNAINLPIEITSGYRSKLVNLKVGGSPTSKHMQGLACDFNVINKSPEEGAKIVLKACKKNEISFDKILIEKGCIHIQFQLTEKLNQNFVGFAKLVNGQWIVNKA